jgi:hypothetical protein
VPVLVYPYPHISLHLKLLLYRTPLYGVDRASRAGIDFLYLANSANNGNFLLTADDCANRCKANDIGCRIPLNILKVYIGY